jgi:hypothetical protein
MKNILYLTFLGLFMVAIYFCFNPVVYSKNEDIIGESVYHASQSDTITPLENLNTDEIYIIIDGSDITDLPDNLGKGKVYFTSDNLVISDFVEKFRVKNTNIDKSTCESFIVAYKEGRMVFKSAIVLSKNENGIQNRTYGWSEIVESEGLLSVIKRFNRYYLPFLVL